MTFPNFLIIGAAKSATTALYHYLGQHHSIYLPQEKESNYFISGDKPLNFAGPLEEFTINRKAVTTWTEYYKLFAAVDEETAIGEVCPSYLRNATAAKRIKEKLPQVKIIAILRNPVDRAYSEYLMRRGLGIESLNFEQALEDEPRRIAANWSGGDYINKGYYGDQLEYYYANFPREQILILRYEDFCQNSSEILNKICRFIGVEPRSDWDLKMRHNISGEITNPLLRILWVKSAYLRGLLQFVIPRFLKQYVSKKINSVRRTQKPLADKTRHQLTKTYQDDIHKCADLTGLDLQSWRIVPGYATDNDYL